LREVKLLCPTEPQKILAVGRNYRSHLGTPPAPEQPELFWKPPPPCRIRTSHRAAARLHRRALRGELVLVIGGWQDLSVAEARSRSSGSPAATTSASGSGSRAKKDLQWWRAKGATPSPLRTFIATA
jgi:2-keto-4-pentenoate hydratase/2-oxohepta-3-ene-1,7-dioic acid hydratase in catechol pathway